jgi:hypothetical protein
VRWQALVSSRAANMTQSGAIETTRDRRRVGVADKASELLKGVRKLALRAT